MNMLTKDEAKMIVEAHEIDSLVYNEEEVGLLKEHNPDLLDAYKALLRVAGWELP